MSRESKIPREPITDSAWFWLFVFGGAALIALAAIGPKYLRRQASIERQYYARETTLARQAERQMTAARQAAPSHGVNESAQADYPRTSDGSPSGAPTYAPPSRLLIPLAPLAGVIAALLVLAMISRAVLIRRRSGRAAARSQEAIHP